jgi:hypothetical protein
MKKWVIAIAVFVMIGLLFAAFAWDCVRLASDARQRLRLADEDVQKHEMRLISLLKSDPKVAPEVMAAIAAHEKAVDRQVRHTAYDDVVSSFRNTMSLEVDPTNPLDRKFMDDMAGAMNRREIALKISNAESDAYMAFRTGPRGIVANWFSPQTRTAATPKTNN